MTDIQIETQYTTGASRRAIEQALVAAGRDLDHLRPAVERPHRLRAVQGIARAV